MKPGGAADSDTDDTTKKQADTSKISARQVASALVSRFEQLEKKSKEFEAYTKALSKAVAAWADTLPGQDSDNESEKSKENSNAAESNDVPQEENDKDQESSEKQGLDHFIDLLESANM